MPKMLKALPIILTFIIVPQVFAQGSPFGNLADERNTHRVILEFRGVGLNDYRSVRQGYQDLQSSYNNSVGTRRDEISSQMVSRAKDILTAKLGATLSHLEDLRAQLADSGRVSEETLLELAEISERFSTTAATLKPQIDEAESLVELRALLSQVNAAAQTATNESRVMNATLNVASGEYLIEQIEDKARVVYAHINSAADLGGDVLSIQRKYDDSMTRLSSAKTTYARVNELVTSDTPLTSTQLINLRSWVSSANSDLRQAHTGLKEVLSDLRVLYSRSPWELKL